MSSVEAVESQSTWLPPVVQTDGRSRRGKSWMTHAWRLAVSLACVVTFISWWRVLESWVCSVSMRFKVLFQSGTTVHMISSAVSHRCGQVRLGYLNELAGRVMHFGDMPGRPRWTPGPRSSEVSIADCWVRSRCVRRSYTCESQARPR